MCNHHGYVNLSFSNTPIVHDVINKSAHKRSAKCLALTFLEILPQTLIGRECLMASWLAPERDAISCEGSDWHIVSRGVPARQVSFTTCNYGLLRLRPLIKFSAPPLWRQRCPAFGGGSSECFQLGRKVFSTATFRCCISGQERTLLAFVGAITVLLEWYWRGEFLESTLSLVS